MGFKSTIRSLPLGEYLVSEYHCVMSWLMPKLVPDEEAIRRYYRKRSGGREVDLEHPLRFSEKLQWYKLHARLALMQQCADKYAVREYIKACGREELLNELLGVYTKPSEIDYDTLPDRFVIKAAHGSGFNIIVKDKSRLDQRRTNRMLRSWMHQNIAWSGREWVYLNMPRHIIIEKYLEDESGGLLDYKFYCFNGKPRFLQVEVGRFTDRNTRNFYDMDWKLLPFGKELPHDPTIVVERPALFDEMKEIAEALCKPFQYVRVDLYQAEGKVYFGELTFFPAGGAPDFVPDAYDRIVGDMWELQDLPNEV